jgi:DNA-binding XRE family transcriptional regulator
LLATTLQTPVIDETGLNKKYDATLNIKKYVATERVDGEPAPDPRTSGNAERCFGQILRELRKERGLTQEGLAEESGFHPTYIGQLERAQKSPSLRTIVTLATVLQTTGSAMLLLVERRIDSRK